VTTEEMAEMAACASNALETLQANEAELLRDMDRLEMRLDVTRETIALLKGEHARQRKAPRAQAKRNATPPVEPFITAELEPEPVTP
jgi:hypothetical protein